MQALRLARRKLDQLNKVYKGGGMDSDNRLTLMEWIIIGLIAGVMLGIFVVGMLLPAIMAAKQHVDAEKKKTAVSTVTAVGDVASLTFSSHEQRWYVKIDQCRCYVDASASDCVEIMAALDQADRKNQRVQGIIRYTGVIATNVAEADVEGQLLSLKLVDDTGVLSEARVARYDREAIQEMMQ